MQRCVDRGRRPSQVVARLTCGEVLKDLLLKVLWPELRTSIASNLSFTIPIPRTPAHVLGQELKLQVRSVRPRRGSLTVRELGSP